MEKRGRSTKQLEAVWEAVKDEKSHPTADQVYEKVRSKVPNISLGTVYRNLQKLVSEQKLQVLTLERTQRFDPMVHRHQHFVCERCGRVYDIFLNPKETSAPPSLTRKGFQVTSHQLSLYGTCKECSSQPL